MDIRKLQRAIVDGLEDVKAQDIVVFNTEHLSPLFERVIIASGTSNRQTKALASSVRDAVKGSGFPVMRTEGEENGEWIIVDCGAAVAHIMQPAIREYYHLEEIWGSKPVRLKKADAAEKATSPARSRRKAVVADPVAPEVDEPPARKTPRSSRTGAKAPAKAAPRAAARPAAARDGVERITGTRGTAARSSGSSTGAGAPRKTASTKAVAGRSTASRGTATRSATVPEAPPARKRAVAGKRSASSSAAADGSAAKAVRTRSSGRASTAVKAPATAARPAASKPAPASKRPVATKRPAAKKSTRG